MKENTETQQRELAIRLSQTDRHAFDELFRALYPRLVRYTFRITRDWEASDDITQDAFVMLWQKRENIDPDRSVRAYLYQSVRNRALNYLRDHRKMTGSDGLEDFPDPSYSTDTQHMQDGHEELLEKKLYEWISALPERQREAFEMSRFEGLYHHEIAGIMGISVKTVNNHLTDALKQLRHWYQEFRQSSNTRNL